MSDKSGNESREGVSLTNLDQPLFDGADATKRDLIDYLDGVRDRIIPVLQDRPLSVIRVHRGQDAFMQKNVPKYTPSWVRTTRVWAEASKREVRYALCNDRRTLLWFANQRAVEYHPTLARVERPDRMTHLVLDLDPPDSDAFSMAVRVAHVVRRALAEVGLVGVVKTSGAKGVHVFVPIDEHAPPDDSAAAHAGHRGARRASRPRDRHDGVHQGGPGQQGVRRFDARRRGHRDCGLQPAGPPGRPRVVPGRLGRSRRHRAHGLHHSHRPATPRGPRPVGRADARPAVVACRPHRGGPRHPGGAGASHARGQTPRRAPGAPRKPESWRPSASIRSQSEGPAKRMWPIRQLATTNTTIVTITSRTTAAPPCGMPWRTRRLGASSR